MPGMAMSVATSDIGTQAEAGWDGVAGDVVFLAREPLTLRIAGTLGSPNVCRRETLRRPYLAKH